MYPASQNAYTYTYNNPVLYTDPGGDCVDLVTGAICLGAAAAAGAIMNMTMQLDRHNGNWECMDWGEVALWAGAGALAGIALIAALPVIVVSPDSALDIASFTYNMSIGDYNAARWDAVSLLLPGVALGLGAAAYHIFSHADDGLRIINRLGDVSYSTRHVNNFGEYGDDIQSVIRNLDLENVGTLRTIAMQKSPGYLDEGVKFLDEFIKTPNGKTLDSSRTLILGKLEDTRRYTGVGKLDIPRGSLPVYSEAGNQAIINYAIANNYEIRIVSDLTDKNILTGYFAREVRQLQILLGDVIINLARGY